MFTTIFYSTLLPIGLLYTAIGLSIYYVVLKLILYNVRSVNENLSSKIAENCIELLEIIIPLYCTSNLLMNILLNGRKGLFKLGYWDMAVAIFNHNP